MWKFITMLMCAFVFGLFCTNISAHVPAKAPVAQDQCYAMSDAGVPVVVTLITCTNIEKKIACESPDYLLPWSNDATGQSQVLTAELPNNLYDVSEPVFRIKSQYKYSQNYKSPELATIERYSDVHHNFG